MTDAPHHGAQDPAEPVETPEVSTGPAPGTPGSFGEEAAEMANETEVEAPAEGQEAGDVELEDDLTRTRRDLAELTTDLQRLQAEYLNYKRRVERDRELIRENATYAALAPIVEVLDTIDRAREHGEVDGGFKAVADQLERVVTSLGLSRFGAVGDPFDPSLHEALSHIGEDPEVSVTTCKVIAKAGYRIGDRVVRAAQVLVVDPAGE
ncbi:nucleotide exchange factor GrpE [Nocardioides sp. MAHUQ-72]|uniref:nucleotide exchange factor GrpE n=1 Tax=unclassified Nocardioides TaxID=2615069 RepID=UPI00360CF6D3